MKSKKSALLFLPLVVSFLYAMETQTITPANIQLSYKGSLEFFTGDVRVDPLFSAKESAPFSGAYVTFEPKARSHWHIHPTGQYLIVTSGVGWTQEWGKAKVEVRAGDTIWCPPHVKHWHGATTTTPMTHIAITGIKEGKSVEWMEKVSDEHYTQNLIKE